MKKAVFVTVCLALIFSFVSCESIGTPIDTGVDSDGIDGGIKWIYDLDAYPTYGIDRQRQKHYYTYDVTTSEIEEYISMLINVGYTVSEAYGTAVSDDSTYPVGVFTGAEAYYVMTKDDSSIILTYIYQSDGTWISEVDS